MSNNFIPRKFNNTKSNNIVNFEEVINSSNISIILGEPASGKTYQLKTYETQNINSAFVELMFIDEEENINENIEIVLLDSIDEALSKNDSDKVLARKLTQYIKKCKQINLNVRFVISCRYVEWKEIFESQLEEIDKDFKVYSIEELSREDIDLLLQQNSIDKNEFWNFIKTNYLEQLLKNILMTIHLINNFDSYKNRELKYFEIYEKIIEEHLLAETDNERKEQLKELSLDDMVKISSVIATYMTLNRTRTISIENINRLANDVYLLDGIEIIGKKLEIIFDTALFSGKRRSIRFFHTSVQEYLTAYFINLKQLDVPTIQKIFTHNMGFYEEFEEVIIHLTNRESKFFQYFLELDPLIFRRHPYLSKEEQSSLFISMLQVLNTDEQRGWTKWKYIENSSLVIFPLLKDDIVKILLEYIQIDNINYSMNVYLISLLEHNYSTELEDILFEIFGNIKDRTLCFKYIEAHYISDINFNQRLFDFIIEHKYIDDESYLYRHLFKVLYQKRDFIDLLVLLNSIQVYELKGNLINNIKENDIIQWFNFLIKDTKNKYSPKIISLLIFNILKKYKKIKNKELLETIFFYIDNDRSYRFKFNISDYEVDNIFLDFDDIKNEFWDYFFTQSEEKKYYCDILKVLKFYKISIEDIMDISKKYPIEDYIKYYICFRNNHNIFIENIESFLMKNIKFKTHMEELWTCHEKEREKEEKEDKEWEVRRAKEKNDELKIYKNAINSLKTKEDLINIYSFVHNNSSEENIHEKLLSDLKDKYKQFIDLAYIEFRNDITYMQVQDNILSNSFSYFNLLINYIGKQLPFNQIEKFISIKEDYRKLYWHLFKSRKLSEKYFYNISKIYVEECINLVIITMNSFLIQSKYIGISNYCYNYNEFFKQIGIYNQEDLRPIIDYSKEVFSIHYKTIKDDKNTLIEIISVDKSNYKFIKKFLLQDKKNYSDYFESLLIIDTNKAIDDFLNIFYPKEKENHIVFSEKNNYSFLSPIYHFSQYDVMNINPIKRKYLKILLAEIHSIYQDKDPDFLKKINDKHIEFIVKTYYEFFKKYSYPKGGYSPDIYDNMNSIINKIITNLGEDTKYISLLKKMINSGSKRLERVCKRQLENLYNLQLNNSEFDNNYYQNILNNYKNTKNRFFDYDKLKDDLIEISIVETKNRNAISRESEDEINDRFRNALHYKNYNVTDQSRGGESSSGINAGERDLVICNSKGLDESVIEAFILNSLDATVINKHYEKLVKRYDTVGNSINFILVYSKTKNFDNLWKKYIEFDGFDNFVDTENEFSQKANVRVGISEYNQMRIYHLFINFYSHGGD